jgi:hypothetical protein
MILPHHQCLERDLALSFGLPDAFDDKDQTVELVLSFLGLD